MIGTVIHGQYRILELLGAGGMGEVYKALDVELERLVALKFLKAEFGGDQHLIQRFRDELRTLAGFNHPNITTLYHTFPWDGRPVMVMELVEGETLLSMVNRRGPIPAHVCVPMIKQALGGVGEAHRKMIIHRDLKPANLMLNRDGVVKVMDFGIAKIQNSPGLTRSNAAIGTCLYMAPEQIRGSVDRRTDIYAMGVTLYELLAGRVPFHGDSEYDIQTAHIQQAPQPPNLFYPHIPNTVVEAVMRALAKDPGGRFQTADEFASALGDGQPQPDPIPAYHTPANTQREITPDFTPVPRTGSESPAVMHAATPSQAAAAVSFATPVPASTPVPSWTPAPTPAPSPAAFSLAMAKERAEHLLRRLDPTLESWFGRTGRPRLTGAAVAVAALTLLAGGGILIRALMEPTPIPISYEKASLSGSTGSAESLITGGSKNGEDKGQQGTSTDPAPGQQTPTDDPKHQDDSKKTDGQLQPSNQQASLLAGRWTGTYERCEDNQRTQAALELTEPTPGAVSGILLLSTPGGSVERCSLSGTYEAQAKSFSFTVPSCAGPPTPSYLGAPHRNLLRLNGSELTGEIEPQDACVTARFKKM